MKIWQQLEHCIRWTLSIPPNLNEGSVVLSQSEVNFLLIWLNSLPPRFWNFDIIKIKPTENTNIPRWYSETTGGITYSNNICCISLFPFRTVCFSSIYDTEIICWTECLAHLYQDAWMLIGWLESSLDTTCTSCTGVVRPSPIKVISE